MKVYFVTLGCDKNTCDSQMMLGLLVQGGHEIVLDISEAMAAIINTCSFIGDAKKESIDTIIEIGSYKNNGKLKKLIITGCLAERYSKEIFEELPEVDAIVGIQGFDRIVEILEGEEKQYLPDINGSPICINSRVLTQAMHYAYLKIAEGCNKNCTYCAIPFMRGSFRSIPIEKLISQAYALAKKGVKEIIIVAQESTLYGIDLYGEKSLPRLLRALSDIEDIYKIRLLYCYPEEITDELIDEMANNPKIWHYIDMPVQSGSDKILRAMGRATRNIEIINLINKLRAAMPDIAIRTSLITGFPGEKRRDFIDTYELVKKIGFDRLGVFTYSAEEGTKAAIMKGQVPEFIKMRRRRAIMRLQERLADRKSRSLCGKIMEVIVDGKLYNETIQDETGLMFVYSCRSLMDAPEVDGIVFVDSYRELNSGDIIKAKIYNSKGYDLYAKECIDELT